YYLRGAETYFAGFQARGDTVSSFKQALQEAQNLLEQAISIDPHHGRAHAMLSWVQMHTYLERRDCDYLSVARLDRAYELAKRAVQLDPNLPQAHAQLGWVLLFKRQHDPALTEFERACRLNPNFVDNRFGLAWIFAGQAARAIQVLQSHALLDS